MRTLRERGRGTCAWVHVWARGRESKSPKKCGRPLETAPNSFQLNHFNVNFQVILVETASLFNGVSLLGIFEVFMALMQAVRSRNNDAEINENPADA